MINNELFTQSFFSIGGGLDIQPMLRFTHVTDTFINLNLGMPAERILSWYNNAFASCNDIEILEINEHPNITENHVFELPPNYRQYLDGLAILGNENSYRAYMKTFEPFSHLSQFAIHWKLKRPSLGRELDFWFITAEGLAMYMILSQKGRFAPKILSTIQTGVLEDPDGLLNRFFEYAAATPQLWVRGFQPEHEFRDSWDLHNNSLDHIGHFKRKAQGFIFKWTCGWWGGNDNHILTRYCKGFVTDAEFDRLKELTFESNGQHQIVMERFNSDHIILGRRNLVASPQIKYAGSPLDLNEFEWIKMNLVSDEKNVFTGSQFVQQLANQLREKNVGQEDVVHIIPAFFEDQGASYMNEIQQLNVRTVTYCLNPWDFIDLRTEPHR